MTKRKGGWPVISGIGAVLAVVIVNFLFRNQLSHLSTGMNAIIGTASALAGYVLTGFLTGWK